jgi:hypothetical protein
MLFPQPVVDWGKIVPRLEHMRHRSWQLLRPAAAACGVARDERQRQSQRGALLRMCLIALRGVLSTQPPLGEPLGRPSTPGRQLLVRVPATLVYGRPPGSAADQTGNSPAADEADHFLATDSQRAAARVR